MNTPAFLNKSSPLLFRLLLAFGMFLVAAIGFAALAHEVPEGETLPYDVAILRAINHFSTPLLDRVVVAYTNLGGLVVVSCITVLLTGYLLWKKDRYKAILILTGVGGAALVGSILKLVFERSRPDLWVKLVTETSFSFPSGHATASSALAFSVIAILWNTKWRALGIFGGMLYVLLIGFSRLYLGVHYPSDILGGWLLSLAWVSIVIVLIRGYRYRKNPLEKHRHTTTEN